ncbi:MAG: hypothetical protein ACE5FM_07895, partial [Methyloligellaceae bacterium]
MPLGAVTDRMSLPITQNFFDVIGSSLMFMHMIRARSWLLHRAALAALCCAVLGLPGAQAEPGSATGPQTAAPERPLLPKAEANTAAERRELLGELYHR